MPNDDYLWENTSRVRDTLGRPMVRPGEGPNSTVVRGQYFISSAAPPFSVCGLQFLARKQTPSALQAASRFTRPSSPIARRSVGFHDLREESQFTGSLGTLVPNKQLGPWSLSTS